MDEKDWIALFRRKGLLWQYDRDAEGCSGAVHARLTSGKHADTYCFLDELVQEPALLLQAAQDLAALVPDADAVGVPFAGNFLAAMVAACQGRQFYPLSKVGDTMGFERFIPQPGTRVVLFDDVLTTGKNLSWALAACRQAQLDVVGIGVVLAYDSAVAHELDAVSVHALVRISAKRYDPAECPLCQAGSLALAPKRHRVLFRK